jgi:hypothetical protein
MENNKIIVKALAEIPVCLTCLLYDGRVHCCNLYGRKKQPCDVGCKEYVGKRKEGEGK